MSASSQVMVQWTALHGGNHHGSNSVSSLHVRKRSVALHARKQSIAVSKQLLHELAPPSLSEFLWLTVLFFWAVFCCPVTRLAFEVIGWVLDDLIPEASDIALSTDL
ncbi:uncharacterized protein PG986_008972 [Apiospora aurea]|uniref:Uncharacterized protein n=1 Tax=Apiospora aurea TaxID=335848 RepID=A0ABR1Q7L8_9PEZI